MDNQRTILKEAVIEGMGLHTAKTAKIIFKPAQVDSGINFVRMDLPGEPALKAVIDNAIFYPRSLRRTSIGKDGIVVHTIEHLMAALSGLGIDNLRIELNNEEVPGLDGSSRQFVEALLAAGIKEQEKERHHCVIKEPLSVEEGSSSIVILPFDGFKISYNLDYNHHLLKGQFKELVIGSDIFKNEISSARTFCLEAEANELQNQGFGMGANYDNTLVVGENGVIKNKLRFNDEFIRHKILDLIGDLRLVGCALKGHVIALRSGHTLNMKLVKKIVGQRQKNLSGGITVNYDPVEGQQLDSIAIMRILPHREPFLFVDRITELEKGKRAVGIKNVTINDYFFKGHFPGKPVMPGVIIIEAMAQVGGIMMLSPEENRGKLAYFMAINNVKFRKPVVPGDQLVFEVVVGKIKSRTGQVSGKAYVDGKVVAQADLMFALAEI